MLCDRHGWRNRILTVLKLYLRRSELYEAHRLDLNAGEIGLGHRSGRKNLGFLKAAAVHLHYGKTT